MSRFVLKYYSRKRPGKVEGLPCETLDELVKESADMARRGFVIAGAEERR